MVASNGSHFETKLHYLQKLVTDFHAVCIIMCSFPKTFSLDTIHLYICVPFPLKNVLSDKRIKPARDRPNTRRTHIPPSYRAQFFLWHTHVEMELFSQCALKNDYIEILCNVVFLDSDEVV